MFEKKEGMLHASLRGKTRSGAGGSTIVLWSSSVEGRGAGSGGPRCWVARWRICMIWM